MFNDLSLLGEWPQSNVVESKWKARCQSGQSFHNCYLVFGASWQVKLYLGKEQRVLGQSHNGATAARFADMAIVHFLPYRKRKLRALTDADVNFSLAQAQSDALAMPNAKQLLVDFEQALLSKNLIERVHFASGDTAPRNVGQIRKDLLLTFEQLRITFGRAKNVLSIDSNQNIKLALFDEQLDLLSKHVRSLDESLAVSKPPTPLNQNEIL